MIRVRRTTPTWTTAATAGRCPERAPRVFAAVGSGILAAKTPTSTFSNCAVQVYQQLVGVQTEGGKIAGSNATGRPSAKSGEDLHKKNVFAALTQLGSVCKPQSFYRSKSICESERQILLGLRERTRQQTKSVSAANQSAVEGLAFCELRDFLRKLEPYDWEPRKLLEKDPDTFNACMEKMFRGSDMIKLVLALSVCRLIGSNTHAREFLRRVLSQDPATAAIADSDRAQLGPTKQLDCILAGILRAAASHWEDSFTYSGDWVKLLPPRSSQPATTNRNQRSTTKEVLAGDWPQDFWGFDPVKLADQLCATVSPPKQTNWIDAYVKTVIPGAKAEAKKRATEQSPCTKPVDSSRLQVQETEKDHPIILAEDPAYTQIPEGTVLPKRKSNWFMSKVNTYVKATIPGAEAELTKRSQAGSEAQSATRTSQGPANAIILQIREAVENGNDGNALENMFLELDEVRQAVAENGRVSRWAVLAVAAICVEKMMLRPNDVVLVPSGKHSTKIWDYLICMLPYLHYTLVDQAWNALADKVRIAASNGQSARPEESVPIAPPMAALFDAPLRLEVFARMRAFAKSLVASARTRSMKEPKIRAALTRSA